MHQKEPAPPASVAAVTEMRETPSPSVDQIRSYVRDAFAGMTDKQGRDYFEFHLLPVAAELVEHGTDAEIAGLLHDIVEDTAVSLDDLRTLGVPEAVVRAVDSVTKREGEVYDDLIARSAADPLGRIVKLADNAVNLASNASLAATDPDRAAELHAKYTRARATLLAAGD